MSYYQREDEPDMSNPDVAVDIWQQTAAAMATFGAEAALAMAASESALGSLYQKAEAAGDEEGQAAVMVAWGRAQQMGGQVQQLDGAMVSAMAAIEALVEHRRRVVEELESLTEAIDEADIHDHRLADLVEVVTEIAEEDMQTWADEAAAETLYNEVYDVLKPYTARYSVTTRLVDILYGEAMRPGEEVALRAFVGAIAALTPLLHYEVEAEAEAEKVGELR